MLGQLLAFGLGATAVPRARAQDTQVSDSPEYRAAIDEAVQEFKDGVWTQARGAFARAHAIQPSARTFRGLGLSSFYLADYVAARLAFEQALVDERRPLTAEQRSELTGLLARAVQETGRYRLQVTPSTAHVVVDDIPRNATAIVLARGTHTLRARENTFRAYESTWVVNGGEDEGLEIVLDRDLHVDLSAPSHETDPANEPRTSPGAHASNEKTGPRTFTWIALGAAPVFGGVAAGVWFAGKSKNEEIDKACRENGCRPEDITSKKKAAHIDRYETWSSVLLGASITSLVAAGVLYFVEGRPVSDSGRATLSVSPSGAGFSASF